MWNATFESKVEPKSNLRLFQSQIRRKSHLIYVYKQSDLIDSNVALHMHLTLALSSAHVKFDVWTGPKSKHFDITISLICATQITDLKINVYADKFTPGHWNIDPFLLLILKNLEADNKTQYLLQNPYIYAWRIYTGLLSTVFKCSSAGWLAPVTLHINVL